MTYFIIENDHISEICSDYELIEKANEWKAEDNAYDRSYPRNKPYPNLSLDGAIEYIQSDLGLEIIKGEYL